jgi:hypothetical protein
MTTHDMDCRTLDDRLADYLEGDLAAAERRQLEAHLASCVRCTALVRELEQIRAGAADLPELTPSRDLWAGIARRIEAPVVPLAARSAPNVTVRRRGFDRLRTAAIAAALVAVTAGVTYTLTIARNETARTGNLAKTAPSGSDSNKSAADAPVSPTPNVVAATQEPTPDTQPSGALSPNTGQKNVTNLRESAADSRDIDKLRAIFLRNRAQLDPRTAAIIEANLKVIDDAIAQSRAALAQDPASRFLKDQLKSAVDKKVELLRTAALLPNRT